MELGGVRLTIVDENVNASYGVVLAGQALQVGGVECHLPLERLAGLGVVVHGIG